MYCFPNMFICRSSLQENKRKWAYFFICSLHASLLLWIWALWPALSIPVSVYRLVCLLMHLIMCLVVSFLVSLYVSLHVLVPCFSSCSCSLATPEEKQLQSYSSTHVVSSIHCLRSMSNASRLAAVCRCKCGATW